MAVKYHASEELQTMGRRIISEHRPDLVGAVIGYYFRYGTWTSNGNIVCGRASKPGGLLGHITECDFIITINSEAWGYLSPEGRTALLDHELEHCRQGLPDKEGNPTWTMQGHDFEDFGAIVARHGLWTQELKKIPEAIEHYEQLTFPGLKAVK